MKKAIYLSLICFCLTCISEKIAARGEPESYPMERVLVHTDRDIYVSGEYLHFKTWLVSDRDNEMLHSGLLYMVLRNQHGTTETITLKLREKQLDGNIYLHDTLSSGYYELVAFTNWMRNTGEESFFRKTIFVANRFDQTLAVLDNPRFSDWNRIGEPENDSCRISSLEKNPFPENLIIDAPETARKRDKIRVRIGNPNGNWINMAVSVVNTETLTGDPKTIYSDKNILNRFAFQDNRPLHFMETNDLVLSGSVTYDGEPVRNARVILNSPWDKVNLLYAETSKDGVFHFSLPEEYTGRELFLSVDPSTANINSQISLMDKFKLQSDFQPEIFPGLWDKKDIIRKSQDVVRAGIAYHINYNSLIEPIEQKAPIFSEIYSNPQITIYPRDFTPFDDLQEIAREIIPEWRIRQSQGVYRGRLIHARSGSFLPDSTTYFIDGIICHDINLLTHLGSDMIEKIEIQNLPWVQGKMEFQGIVAIFSKSQEYLNITTDMPVVRTTYEIQQKQVLFNPPVYDVSTIDPGTPDLRQLLYWHPELHLSGGQESILEFHTGDLAGEYALIIRGVTSEGDVLNVSRIITIK